MRMVDSPVFREYMKTPREGAYDFYRCMKCDAIFTRETEVARLRAGTLSHDDSRPFSICACGSLRYSPSWPYRSPAGPLGRFLGMEYKIIRGNQWLDSYILAYTLKLVLARGVAPWLDRHFPQALGLVERLVAFDIGGV